MAIVIETCNGIGIGHITHGSLAEGLAQVKRAHVQKTNDDTVQGTKFLAQ